MAFPVLFPCSTYVVGKSLSRQDPRCTNDDENCACCGWKCPSPDSARLCLGLFITHQHVALENELGLELTYTAPGSSELQHRGPSLLVKA